MSTIGNRTDIWLSKCTSVQITNITKVCVQNVLRVLECKLQVRGRHCLIASSMNTWWKCSHCSTRRNFSWSTSWIYTITHSCSFPKIWLAVKFCDEFFAPYPFSCLSTLTNNAILRKIPCLLFTQIVYVDCVNTTLQVTAVSNTILETELFCHRNLKINNSAIK